MKMKPFGFPAWSKTKKRIAKKIINKYGRNMFERFKVFSSYSVGDLIRTCDGLNSKIVEIEPIYVYTRRGKILVDFEIITDKTFCSMYRCGVAPPISYEEALNYRNFIVKSWESNDEWGFAERYSKMIIYEDGTYKG